MLVPDICYGFSTPTDTAGPTFEIFSRHFQLSASEIVVEVFVRDIPKDRILVLSNMTIRADPGTGQGIDQLVFQGITQAGLNFNILTRFVDLAAGIRGHMDWQGEVFIMGGGDGRDSVRIFGAFTSATNANLINVGLSGVIIPHGNAAAF